MIEIDVTTYTAAEDYLPYRVPEVWLFKKSCFSIHQLEDEAYTLRETSQFFPGVDVTAIADHCLQAATERSTGVALGESSINDQVKKRCNLAESDRSLTLIASEVSR